MEDGKAVWKQPKCLILITDGLCWEHCSFPGLQQSQGSQQLYPHHTDTFSIPPPSISSLGWRFVP